MKKDPQDTASRHADKYIIRFEEGLKERIAQAATENKRSLNAEINARLQASFAEKPALEEGRLEAILGEAIDEMLAKRIEWARAKADDVANAELDDVQARAAAAKGKPVDLAFLRPKPKKKPR